MTNNKRSNGWLKLSARWRPKKFSEVVGQDVITSILINSIRYKKLTQAYLLSGTRGCGKTTLARLFAKSLNCLYRSEQGEPCQTCHTCLEIHRGNSLDVIEMDGASHRGIDDIKSIMETCRYATSSGGFKVYIIDEAHMLTREAFNALLKTLEDPPHNVIFILATTEAKKIPLTVSSRCMNLHLKRISDKHSADKIRTILKEIDIEFDHDIPEIIANRADGSLRDAESLLQQVLAFSDKKIKSSEIQTILGILPSYLLLKLDRAIIDENKKDALIIGRKMFVSDSDTNSLLAQLMDHYISHTEVLATKDDRLIPKMYETSIEKFKSINQAFSSRCLSYIIRRIRETLSIVQIGPRPIFESMILELTEAFYQVELESLIGAFLCEEKKEETNTIKLENSNKEKTNTKAMMDSVIYFISTELDATVSVRNKT